MAIDATCVATGLSQPVYVGAPPGDTSRLFIVERTGLVRILDLATNQILPTPFLDLRSQVNTVGEGGLLGLAFDPNYAQNGFIYVDFTNGADDTEVRRYQVSGDPNRIDPASQTLILTVDQPAGLTNHKAGWLDFGPDGYLYVSLGDGGGGGDPNGNGQNPDTLLGSMLRLDVRGDAFPTDPNRNYAIPPDNPFVGVAGADEIFALGLRNPFRNSFDRELGDFYIADVGQNRFEEVDIGRRGANYGWNVFEGNEPFASGPLGPGTLTFPIHVYDHSFGNAITGGYVYRGSESGGLQGDYFFADSGSGRVFTLHFNGTSWVATERTSEIAANVGAINTPVSFGEDGNGNLYIVDLDGDVFRLTPVAGAPPAPSADADATFGDGNANAIDALAGDDSVSGLGGNDSLLGNAGNDSLLGGRGDNSVSGGLGNDLVSGQDGNDLLLGDEGLDTLLAGEGNNTVVGGQDSADGADLIAARGGNDLIYGNGGADTIAASGGANTVIGGFGSDSIVTGAGDDIIVGGLGDDSVSAGAGNDIIYGNLDRDLVYGNLGGDILYGGQQADVFYGGRDADIVYGNFDNDVIYGNFANDLVFGGQGNDFMYGGQGDDTVVGNLGDDSLFGNLGADLFILGLSSGVDRVSGFSFAESDRINIQGQTYTTVDTALGLEVHLSGGGTIVLLDIHAGDFSSAFFV